MARGNERSRSGETTLEIGAAAAALLDTDQKQIIYIASDEARAEAIVSATTAAAGERLVVHLPASDALPGDVAKASPGVSGRRVAALRRLADAASRGEPAILVTSGEAAARLLPPASAFAEPPITLAVGDALDLEDLHERLLAGGYFEDDRVDEPGELAFRSTIADLFPADFTQPVRIEVVDGRISSLRIYDPLTQLSSDDCERVRIGAIEEPAFDAGVAIPDHLPDAAVAVEPGADRRRKRFLALAEDVASRGQGQERNVYCTDPQWSASLAGHGTLDLAPALRDLPPRFVEQRSPERAFLRFARAELDARRTLLLVGTDRDLRFLERRVAKALDCDVARATSWAEVTGAPAGSVMTLSMPVPRGFATESVSAIAAADLLGRRAGSDRDAPQSAAAAAFAAPEVLAGDVVIDEVHGLGVVDGLAELPGDAGDAIVVRYAGDARRLVPVTEAGRLWRYGSEEEAVTLDKLDGSSWEKRREPLLEAIAETARSLVERATTREAERAPPLVPEARDYERLAGSFPYSETPDQLRAIAAIEDDLASGRPMDRLVVGDVGFGKTEVAIRAAAMTVFAGRQVVIAAPTTVLARQHYETFRNRFEPLGVKVALLSRHVPAPERKAAAHSISAGEAKIVVGTAAVAGKSIAYPDLGLLVIDEEQRFGTADKEKLRALGAPHVLGMTATPIPRTLQSALVGLQAISILATPPARRQPIRTEVGTFDPTRLRAALLRERSRGGQSFVVVPRISGMAPLAEKLRALVPELALIEVHGKMAAADVDEAMVGFASGKGDILLATNIIEAGLDVPRANTMAVVEAERFGLAQLHQLRGRVGRGSRRGHILLMTAEGKELPPRTRARLDTLAALDALGAGFAISARDLDLRGGGDLLGEEQSGHLKLIGVDLYQHLLERALRSARGQPVDEWTAELNLGATGRLSPDWIPEEDVRLALYLRLARITDVASLDAFEAELADRFGELPEDAEALVAMAGIRLLAKDAGIARIDLGPAALALTPRDAKVHAPEGLEEKNGRWLTQLQGSTTAERLSEVEALLAALADT